MSSGTGFVPMVSSSPPPMSPGIPGGDSDQDDDEDLDQIGGPPPMMDCDTDDIGDEDDVTGMSGKLSLVEDIIRVKPNLTPSKPSTCVPTFPSSGVRDDDEVEIEDCSENEGDECIGGFLETQENGAVLVENVQARQGQLFSSDAVSTSLSSAAVLSASAENICVTVTDKIHCDLEPEPPPPDGQRIPEEIEAVHTESGDKTSVKFSEESAIHEVNCDLNIALSSASAKADAPNVEVSISKDDIDFDLRSVNSERDGDEKSSSGLSSDIQEAKSIGVDSNLKCDFDSSKVATAPFGWTDEKAFTSWSNNPAPVEGGAPTGEDWAAVIAEPEGCPETVVGVSGGDDLCFSEDDDDSDFGDFGEVSSASTAPDPPSTSTALSATYTSLHDLMRQLDVQLLPVIEGTFKPESTGDSHDKGYPRKRLMSQCESNDTWSRLRSEFGENFAWNDKASTREVLLKLLNIDPSLANRDDAGRSVVASSAPTGSTIATKTCVPSSNIPAFASSLTLLQPTSAVASNNVANIPPGEGSSSEMSETFNGIDHSEDSNAFNNSDDPQLGSSDVRDLGNLSPVASGRPTSKTPNVSSPEVGVKTMGHSTSSGKNKSHLRGSNGDNELSKKKAQEILDAFPLLDFMRSPTLMYPNSPITRPPDIVQTTANK